MSFDKYINWILAISIEIKYLVGGCSPESSLCPFFSLLYLYSHWLDVDYLEDQFLSILELYKNSIIRVVFHIRYLNKTKPPFMGACMQYCAEAKEWPWVSDPAFLFIWGSVLFAAMCTRLAGRASSQEFCLCLLSHHSSSMRFWGLELRSSRLHRKLFNLWVTPWAHIWCLIQCDVWDSSVLLP